MVFPATVSAFIVGSDHRRNQEMLRKATSLGEDFTLDWLIAEPREVTMRNLHNKKMIGIM